MKNSNVIEVLGKKIKFSSEGDVYGFHYILPNGVGFFNKDNYYIFGKPTKATAKRIAENYISSLPSRLDTWNKYWNN